MNLVSRCILALAITGIVLASGVACPALADPHGISGHSRFSWPLIPHRIVRQFQSPAHLYGPGHRGVDLAGNPGQPVFAAGDGVVRYAGAVVDRSVVSIAHSVALRTTYEPLLPAVADGQFVHRGQLIGKLSTGHADCPVSACLHWGVVLGQDYVNPLRLLGATQVRLLPWREPR